MAGFTRPFSNFRNSQSRFSFNFALQSKNVNFFFSLRRRKTRKKLKSFNLIIQKCRKNNFLFSKFGQRLKLLNGCVNPAAPVIVNFVATESHSRFLSLCRSRDKFNRGRTIFILIWQVQRE